MDPFILPDRPVLPFFFQANRGAASPAIFLRDGRQLPRSRSGYKHSSSPQVISLKNKHVNDPKRYRSPMPPPPAARITSSNKWNLRHTTLHFFPLKVRLHSPVYRNRYQIVLFPSVSNQIRLTLLSCRINKAINSSNCSF